MKRYSNLGTIFIVIYFFIHLLTTLSLPVALLLGLLAGMIFDLSTAIILISFASSMEQPWPCYYLDIYLETS